VRRLAKARAGAHGPRRSGRGAPADRLEREAPRAGSAWDTTLVWFMRLTALAWLAKGLVAWAVIVGALPDIAPFETEGFGRQAAVAYFGIVDLLAGVGLWLASPWGGVIWLLAATSYLVLGLVLPQVVPSNPPILAAGAALILLYLVLSWLAAREVR
jgi:hypothetical protein